MEVKISHTTTVKSVQINDVNALRKTAEDLRKAGVDCELVENSRPRMYYREQEVQCDYVLKLANAKCRYSERVYDVGFQKQKDGTLAPIFDEYGDGVASQLGARVDEAGITAEERSKRTIAKLLSNYAKHATINKARSKGYTVTGVKTDAQGAIQLTIAV